jgi:tRNA(adenine34) deaminase
MCIAPQEAELALKQGERPIGAAIVHEGQVVGRGHAQHRGRHSEIAHAEMNALLEAEQYLHAHTHSCTLYTSVEPCVMCLGAIVMSDIDRVVYALPDRWINPGQMLEMPYVRRHIRLYLGGVLAEESAALWAEFSPRELRMLQEGRL